jgi:hypothetical protein
VAARLALSWRGARACEAAGSRWRCVFMVGAVEGMRTTAAEVSLCDRGCVPSTVEFLNG